MTPRRALHSARDPGRRRGAADPDATRRKRGGTDRWLAALLTGALVASGASAQALPERDSYAWRFPIDTSSDTEFHRLTLTPEVYRSVSDPNLRDLGVYNAAGEPVPRIVRAPERPPDTPDDAFALTAVPLLGPPAAQREQLRVLMQQGQAGTTLSLDTSANGAAAAPQTAQPVAWIVDLRSVDEEFDALRMAWPDGLEGFIGTVRVQTGDDLRNWRGMGQGTVAELRHEDSRIRRDRVPLSGSPGDFLRLTGQDLPPGWTLTALEALRRAGPAEVHRDTVTLSSASHYEDGRGWIYDLGGVPPVDRIGLDLPEGNVVIRARVEYRAGDGDIWRDAAEDVFYHLRRDGLTVASEPVATDPIRAAQWRVVVDSGAVTGPVSLTLGWRPETLLFLAQGDGPFDLVTGRADDRTGDFPQHRLLGDRALFATLETAGPPGDATLNARVPMAGPEALEPDPRPLWRTALVWALLIGAVGVVAWLVLSLVREMNLGK